MNFLNPFSEWLGRPIGLRDGGFWSEYFGARNVTGKPVTTDTALTVAGAFACIRLLGETTGIVPHAIMRKLPNGGSEPATDHPLYGAMHDKPNPDMAASEFWEAVTVCLATDGNAYALKLRVGGRVVGWDLIPPGLVQVYRRAGSNILAYRFTWRGKPYDVTAADLVHWRGFGIGRDKGLNPIRYAANTLGIAMAADDAAGRMFGNGVNMAGFIQSPTVLTEPQREQFRKSLGDYQSDERAGKMMLLEGGFEFKEIGINPNDLQMLQARGFSIEQICSIWRIPPFMIGHTEKQTSFGTGIESQTQSFLTFALLPYLKRIEDRNNLAFLSPGELAAGFYCHFNVEGLLRADSQARAAFYSIVAQNGIYTRNDIRAKENLPKSSEENADKLTVQSNLVPIEKLGDVATAGAGGPKEAIRQWLGIKDPPEPGPSPGGDL